MIPINKRKIGIAVLLSIVTLGIYRIYWEYLLIKNVKAIKGEKPGAAGQLLCKIFIPFYSIFWWLSRGDTVKDYFSERGYSCKSSGILYMILGIFGLNIVSAAIMQKDFNTLPPAEYHEMWSSSEKAGKRGIESMRARYGYVFVAHWMLGLLLFFIIPAISSIIYSFSDITIGDGFHLGFVGLANYKEVIFENTDYLTDIRDSIASMLYSLPMVVALSLILAVLLNQRYPGRTFFRIVFFLPVIISTSVIMRLLADPSVDLAIFNVSTDGQGFMNYEEILGSLELPEGITEVLVFFLTNAVNLTWNCGVQTILFLAGLQSIPGSLYEVSKIEGANKWEEFWKITIPMLRHVLSLVIIYTMIALFTTANNSIMISAIKSMKSQFYGVASAMLWLYFVVILGVIGIALALYNRYCVKKWD